jgi:hypothetical protein
VYLILLSVLDFAFFCFYVLKYCACIFYESHNKIVLLVVSSEMWAIQTKWQPTKWNKKYKYVKHKK